MASPQSKDEYISIPSLVSLQVCPQTGHWSSQQFSGPASQTRARYRKSCTSSKKCIWHIQHSRRVEDGHATRSSSAIATRICFGLTCILSTCCRRVYNGCIRYGVSLPLKASASKRRRVAQLCTVVRVAALMAAYSGRCSDQYRCFPASLYPISVVKSSIFYKTGDSPSLRHRCVLSLQRGLRDN